MQSEKQAICVVLRGRKEDVPQLGMKTVTREEVMANIDKQGLDKKLSHGARVKQRRFI